MNHDRELIAAYVDGELDLIAAKRIEKAMATDAELAAAIAAERALRTRLGAHFAPALDEPVPDRLTALLTGSAKVDTSLADRREARTAARTWQLPAVAQWGAIAASLALGLVVGGYALQGGDGGYLQATPDSVLASGPLAEALETQLASTQGAKPDIRIGTSFADGNGAYCRTFASAAIDGIACKADGQWELRRSQSGGANSDYRQASAGELADAAEAMMAGEPLDATHEKAARDKGWKQ